MTLKQEQNEINSGLITVILTFIFKKLVIFLLLVSSFLPVPLYSFNLGYSFDFLKYFSNILYSGFSWGVVRDFIRGKYLLNN